MTTAILYLPDGMPDLQLRHRLAAYCEAKGYDLDTVHVDGWDAAYAYATEHEAVVVVADWLVVPPDRLPRVELADLDAARPDLPEGWDGDRRRQRPGPA